MREIKFRGMNLCRSWVYGDLRHNRMYMPDGKLKAYISVCGEPVHPKSVGQFTGLLDTARKEIYEGDIVVVKEDDEESRHVVRYMNDEDYPAFDLVPESMSWCGECNGLSYCMIHMDATIYVIGNIYDNPELLEAHA